MPNLTPDLIHKSPIALPRLSRAPLRTALMTVLLAVWLISLAVMVSPPANASASASEAREPVLSQPPKNTAGKSHQDEVLTHLPTAQAAIASTSVAEAPRSATPSSVTSSSDTSSSAIPNSGSPSQQDQLAAGLAEQWWTPLLFLALGIGLAFTPCVLPMYPILSGIVLGNGQVSHRRAFGLAFAMCRAWR